MQYQFSIDSLIEIVTAIAAFVAIALLWNKRKSQEVLYLILLESLVAIWAVTYAFEFATNDLQTKMLWSKLSYFGIAFLPVFYFLFTTAFSQKSKIINKRNIILLSILPVFTIGLILTNDTHKLVWTDVTLDPVQNIAHYHHGVWFWIYWSYAMILFLFGLFNLVHSIYKFTAYYKSQITVLLLASVIPIIGNLMYVTNINPFPGFDWTPVSFVLTGLIIAFGIARYKMFDLVPFDRNKLIDTMDDGAIVVNPEGFVEDCNEAACKIFGTSKKLLLRQQFSKKFQDYKTIIEAVKIKNTERIQIEIANKYYQVRISPIYYKNKNFSGSLLLFHDITNMKHVEEKLVKTNNQLMVEMEKKERLIEDLDSFAHTVAHDLKNTLGSIVSSSELLEETVKSDNKRHSAKLVGLIKNSATKSIRITQELLILATSGDHEIEKSELDMDSVFLEAKNQVSYLIEKEKAEISLPDKWLSAKGYAPWVEEVWVNYLSNAIKYGGSPPVIRLGSDLTNDNKIKFWIKDNGIGLTKEEQEKLFKKYTRLAPEKADGYGLGLSIVKQIIEKLGGEVGVESPGNINQGSTFYFILPIS